MNVVNQITPFLFGFVGAVAVVCWLSYWVNRRRELRWQLYQQKRQQEILDAVDHWHANPQNIPLHEHLGLTPEQYEQWLRDPDTVEMEEISGWKRNRG